MTLQMKKILVALLALLLCSSLARGQANYDESKMPEYELPAPLICLDGSTVKDSATWIAKRRPEVLKIFKEQVYGRCPEPRKDMSFHRGKDDPSALGGLAIRNEIVVRFSAEKGGPRMTILLHLPKKSADPVPLFVGLNFQGNHSVLRDDDITLSGEWMRPGPGIVDHRATEASRGKSANRWPLKTILSRGYGVATIYCGDIDPDIHDGWKNGVHALYDAEAGSRTAESWATISAWAWGLSRALDYFETDDRIDHRRVAVIGHSRLGKTSLWAGARDERFALVISNDSGCGGAALSRRRIGESVKQINKSFPHWFCDNFKKYDDNEDALPVDQHLLIALMAPRPVYVASATGDRWADPRGEFLAAREASPVYALFGKEGLPAKEMPAADEPVMGTIGYHLRTGKHDITEYDWLRYMDFADRHLKSK